MIKLTKVQEEVLTALVRLYYQSPVSGHSLEDVRDGRFLARPRDERYDYIKSTTIALRQLSAFCPNLVEERGVSFHGWHPTGAGVALAQTQLGLKRP